MANLLPPPPTNDEMGSFAWLEWYRQLRTYVSQSGSVPWYIINFSNSNITDIASRSHQQLQELQGGTAGERYHLTAAQHAALAAGNHNDLSSIQGGTAGQYYHINAMQYAAMSNSIEQVCTTSSVTLPTTPTVFNPTYTTPRTQGITYNTSTGEYTFVNGGSYTFIFMLNATASSSNKFINFYVSIDTGSGHVIQRYTARNKLLTNTTRDQVVFNSTNYFAANTKLKIYLWSDDTSMTLNTTDIVAGTVTLPAARIMWSGSL